MSSGTSLEVMGEEPERPTSPDPDLSHLYRLAERIVEAITDRAPDWCAIAPQARELADLIDERCAEARGERLRGSACRDSNL